MLVNILNRLFEYSNRYIEVRADNNLPMPAFSMIEQDIHGRYVPIILINFNLIPKNEDVIAHILSHEWGHHILKHIKLIPPLPHNMPSQQERQIKENEADTYAAKFIKEYSYNREPIIKFLHSHPVDLKNRLAILNSVL